MFIRLLFISLLVLSGLFLFLFIFTFRGSGQCYHGYYFQPKLCSQQCHPLVAVSRNYSFSGMVTGTFMEPDFAAKTFCPVIHLTAFLPWHQAQTPALQHLSPARICTAVITDGDSLCSARHQKPGVVAASPKTGLISHPSPGNICNSVFPFRSLTRALLVPQSLSTDYNRLVVNVASKDKEETCLQQKSQPSEKVLRLPPSFSTVLYDSEQAIYNYMYKHWFRVSQVAVERPETWLQKPGRIPSTEISGLPNYHVCELNVQNTGFVLFLFNC